MCLNSIERLTIQYIYIYILFICIGIDLCFVFFFIKSNCIKIIKQTHTQHTSYKFFFFGNNVTNFHDPYSIFFFFFFGEYLPLIVLGLWTFFMHKLTQHESWAYRAYYDSQKYVLLYTFFFLFVFIYLAF